MVRAALREKSLCASAWVRTNLSTCYKSVWVSVGICYESSFGVSVTIVLVAIDSPGVPFLAT